MRLSCSLAAVVSLGLAASLASAAPTVPDRLKDVSKLTYCSGMDSPPLVSFDAAQKPTGLAIDLGMEIAKRLGDKGLFATLYAGVRTDMLDAPFMRDFLLTAKDTSFANLEGVSVAR